MKIFICASRHLYDHVTSVKEILEGKGHIITTPNNYEDPGKEERTKLLGEAEYRPWKAEMLRLQKKKVEANDAVLVINMQKNGQENYIGGATFLEIYMAFELGKKVFLYNPIPKNILEDELRGMQVEVINGDLELIK